MAGHPSGLPLGHGGQAAQKVQDESNMMGRTGSAGGGGHGRLATWPPGHLATLPPGHQATQLRGWSSEQEVGWLGLRLRPAGAG